jgi:PAS domain S-box-containing protein
MCCRERRYYNLPMIINDPFSPANSQSLLEVLALSKDATAIYDNEALRIAFANDAMIALWGKDRSILGKTFEEAIPELKGQPFTKLLQSVWHTGETFSAKDHPARLFIGGKLLTFHFDFEYRAIVNTQGKTKFILHTASDVSERLLNHTLMLEKEAREQQLNEELAASNEELRVTNDEMNALNEEYQVANRELFVANGRLNESGERFRFLLNAIPQQVWTATPDGLLDYVNQVVSDDFGRSGTIVVGQGWQEFIHPDDLTLALDRWTRALQNNSEYLTEFRLQFADGNYYWHLARALPLITEGKAVLWIGTNTNIHEQKTKEYQKDEFLSIASHELKTPLTTIKAFFQLTKREMSGQSSMAGFISTAERQLERLGRLIEDLLDVSKINAGKMIYNKADFDFKQMVSDVVEAMQQTTGDHQIELHNNCALNFHGDQHRIEQVLINLLNNAIKYSPGAGRVIVRCDVEQQNLVISIQDFGIGIAAEHLKGLFDRFYRVDNSSARFQGLGLGLFISAEIVKRHGGSFWIESQPGEGSTFYCLLPLSGKQEFSEIATDGQTYYEGSHINIRYQPQGQYIDVNWKGYQNYDSVVKGCTIMLDLMQKNSCQKVLNDNTHVKGNWSEASDWGANTWFPAMAKAGLKKFAWIYSPSTFSRIAANVSLPSDYDAVQVAFFDDKKNAANWLLK